VEIKPAVDVPGVELTVFNEAESWEAIA